MIAFSITCTICLSQGTIVRVRASSTATFATCCSGDVAAVVIDPDVVEQARAGAPGAQPLQFVAECDDALAHALGRVFLDVLEHERYSRRRRSGRLSS